MSTELQELSEVVKNQQDQIEFLEESRMADLQLALDNVGWSPLGQDLAGEELDLETIKDTSDTLRALNVINPLVKRGISMRVQYVWGKGVMFKGIDENNSVFQNPLNQRYMFSAEALAEAERCLSTDGNFFVIASGKISGPRGGRRSATSLGSAKLMRVPLQQIVGIVTNPENPEDVWFYRRAWSEIRTLANGQQKVTERIAYYPSDLYAEPKKPKTIAGKPVVWDAVIIEHSVNKQVGWRWGVPDAMAVMFWAKAHKEFLEDMAKLVKAYSRFAFKATAPTPNSVRAVAAKVASPAGRDAMGNSKDIGATAVMGPGANIQAIGRTSGSVDFSAGLPLAGYVAAGLEVPLTDLLSDSSLSNRSAAETLTASKLAAMVSRQKSWKLFFERLFRYWGEEVEAVFDEIENENLSKYVQSVVLASGKNVLSAQEVRDALLKALGIEASSKLPTEEELGLMILDQIKAEEQAADNPAQDQSQPSYGDNSGRENVGAHEYDPTDGRGEQ